jgi:hypothetical protein
MAVIDDYRDVPDPEFGIGPGLFWLSMLAADVYFWQAVARWCAHLFRDAPVRHPSRTPQA